MMIIRFSGGLGNQLFQFAAAKVLEVKFGGSIVVDDSYYDNQPSKDTFRKLEIFQFNVQYTRKSNCKEKSNTRKKVLILKILTRIPWYSNSSAFRKITRLIHIYNEDAFTYHMNARENDYVIGYFQNYSLLKENINIIRQQFTLTPEVDAEMRRLDSYRTISQHDNTIAVHIRRGDYVTNVNASAFHGICDIEYYKKSIELITSRIKDPKFVFFSDDIAWVKEAFSGVSDAYFVENPSSTSSAVDMYLMSLCKHNIIANSTYSWWGAVLNANPEKIVICPERWTLNDSIGQLYVDGWIKL
ncbi:TPA: alpha-1,2-fucosyltransferase [Escherichia coli]